MSRADAPTRDCPNCGAAAGQPCTGRRGPRRGFHMERITGTARPASVATRPSLARIEYQRGDSAALVYDRGLDAYADGLRSNFAVLFALCESPIEELMLAALATHLRFHPQFRLCISNALPTRAAPGDIYCVPQAKVGTYRADFLLIDYRSNPPRKTVVECDGHDFHERTKQQAQRDRSRDRWFTTNGYAVLRFTGSEIYNDLEGVADQIAEWLEQA